ncbi:MAG TPA: carboxypeptidase regulatory-like domain-containing protein [Phycisphaerae bacterium]|nr:carboxypeptidase regulatory-like domain-containing protein [Phycisphaerae bacterium]
MGSSRCRAALLAFAITFVAPLTAPAAIFSGHVTDQTTGRAIAGATITVGNESATYTATTNATGDYQVNVPSATDYTVLASAIGYASKDVVMQTPPAVVNFALVPGAGGYLAQTINQGLRRYEFDGSYCFRVDATVDEDASYFPDIDAQNPTISSFMQQVGAGTNQTTVPVEMWNKIATVWQWLRLHASYNPSSPTWQAAMNYMMAAGWPSIYRIALTYNTYGFIPWGTCMSRAQLLTTILYRTGIPRDRIGIGETRWELRYSQHMYAMVYIADRWMYFDATFSYLACPDFSHFVSIPITGGESRDYCHPYQLMTIPGAGIRNVPEGSARATNSENVYIIAPPTWTYTRKPTLDVTAATPCGGIVAATINSVPCSVTDGHFTARVTLALGVNSVVAQVQTASGTFSDTMTIDRWPLLTCDLNCDETVGVFDIEPFVLALTDPADYESQHADCSLLAADANGDGQINGLDVRPFVQRLIAGS